MGPILVLFTALFIGSIYLLLLIFFNRRKSGKLEISIRDTKFKNQRFILIALILIMGFDFIEFLRKPDLGNLLAMAMFIVMFITNLILQYFGIGIFENGVMFGGFLHSWDRIKGYKINESILSLTIKPKNKTREFQYKFILAPVKKEEALKLLRKKVKK